ncbi:MAG: Biopolymer transport protein ExbD [Pseudomonadota bacterium]|jgi:biopolymer transport protein TolR|nr:protein TolR [Betaproteobacteria bacterium]
MAASLNQRRSRRTISDINMVPFIDVMLVLLIIFMVTAPLLSPSLIDVPSVGKAATAPDQVITIEIDKQLHIVVRSKTSSADNGLQIKQDANMDNVARIALQLQSGKAQTPVIISADKGITYDNVVKLMDRLQRAGVQRVGLAVRQSE